MKLEVARINLFGHVPPPPRVTSNSYWSKLEIHGRLFVVVRTLMEVTVSESSL